MALELLGSLETPVPVDMCKPGQHQIPQGIQSIQGIQGRGIPIATSLELHLNPGHSTACATAADYDDSFLGQVVHNDGCI